MNGSPQSSHGRLILLCLLTLVPLTAAAGVCEETFLSTVEGGSMRFIAVEPQPDAPSAEVIENLKQAFTADGLVVADARKEGDLMLLPALQRATRATPGIMLLANVSDARVDLFTTVPMSVKTNSALRADSEYMRGHLCRLLATAARRGSENVDARTAPPPDRSNARMLRPSMDFDASQARAALEPGTNGIAGAACAYYGGNWVYPSSVILLPLTPYLAEYLRLVKKARATDQVYANPEMSEIRLVGQTNSKGQFRFADLKAGSYYLYTETGARVQYERDVTVGNAYTPIGNYSRGCSRSG